MQTCLSVLIVRYLSGALT